MKVCVTGGRDYVNMSKVAKVLSSFRPITLLIEGGAAGADACACAYARQRGIPHVRYEADWLRFGWSAGPRRNQKMLETEKPDVLVAFPGGKGTEDCVKRAESLGIRVVRIS